VHPLPFDLAALMVTALATAFDWRRRQVPNWVVVGPLPLAPAAWALGARHAHGAFGVPAPLFFACLSIAGAIGCAAVPLLLFRLSMIGGADVKLLATLGALLTAHTGLLAELGALLAAGVFLPARLAYHGRLTAGVLGVSSWFINPLVPADRRVPLPSEATDRVRFTPFILAGVVFATFCPRV
jgi:Flp pilus assembly protein protease CpaA